MPKLNPCPFCQSTNLEAPREGEAYVSCKDCWSNGPDQRKFYDPFVQFTILEAAAIDDWNNAWAGEGLAHQG